MAALQTPFGYYLDRCLLMGALNGFLPAAVLSFYFPLGIEGLVQMIWRRKMFSREQKRKIVKRRKRTPFIWVLAVLVLTLNLFIIGNLSAEYGQQIRFIDSKTGYAVHPNDVSIKDKVKNEIVYKKIASKDGGTKQFPKGILSLSLPRGSFECTVKAIGYRATTASFDFDLTSPQRIEFYLNPVETPPELRTEFIQSLHREDSTVIVGFVVEDESGEPIANVRVIWGSKLGSETNERGFFIVHVPLPHKYEGIPTADITFEKEGYQTVERRYVELWPNGDWIYRIRLSHGEGKKIINEREFRRR